MLDVIEQIGAFAGLAAFLGLAVLALLAFAHGRDIRRLREWAGSAPERDAERKEATSAIAAQRAEELRALETRTAEREAINSREERRRRREAGLGGESAGERVGGFFSRLGGRIAEPRYLAGLFVVMAVVVAGGAYLMLSGDSNGSGTQAGGGNGGGGNNARQTAAKVDPSEVEVAVLNGTSVEGLAATIGDQVESKGFALGAITNTAQSYEESVVMFERGHAPEAKRVANALGIRKVELMLAEVQSVAEGADVAVIAGEDSAAAAS